MSDIDKDENMVPNPTKNHHFKNHFNMKCK